MDLFLIDGISPFFKGYRTGKRINWSKIPFEHLEKDGLPDTARLEGITEDFDRFTQRASEMGYNAVTLDDVAHMMPHSEYEEAVNDKLRVYARWYREWIEIARRRGLRVYITTDFMFYTHKSEKNIGRGFNRAVAWFRRLLSEFFDAYPEVEGVILRIGESDGKDVEGDFISRLVVRTPRQARTLVQRLLPVFEERGRMLVYRLWSVGAYRIGDLIWNRETLRKVFGGVESDQLILSIKYGESDFFRYLPLNKQFFRTPHQKIIELQARREYEGCGEFPSYVGIDYQAYRENLIGVEGLVGISVWCQTGGWTRFRRLTFVENSSVWNEINTWVSIRIFQDNMSSTEALQAYADRYLQTTQGLALQDLMTLSDRVIKQLFYIDEYARRKLFFRRVRLPSTLSVYWDRILILHPVRKFLRCLVENGEAKVAQGDRALKEVETMKTLAQKHDLPPDGLELMEDTFALLAEARRYYFLPYSEGQVARMQGLIETYTQRHEIRYSIRLELTPFTLRSRHLRWILQTMVREKRGYRALDQVFTLRILSILFPLLRKLGNKAVPDFVHRQAMGIEAVFK